MATNNIKIFDQNKANMLTDEAYNTSTQRLNGVQQGIASSQLQNKTLYQVSLVAYAIGQMMQANGLNANDADAVSTFAGNLSSTIVQKILDKASTAEAKNFTVNNKFITPQTWKAVYDFMKADSNMVTSAVDDTHYITPKLLKEGAEKYGDKVRLDDGSLAQWKTFSKIPVNEFNIDILKYKFASSIAGKVYTTMMVPDKLKRYVICQQYWSGSDFPILLYDYNTGELLDYHNIFTYGSYSYSLFNIGSGYNEHKTYGMISALSENMFLLTCKNSSTNHPACLAIDFSTGEFIVKNAYEFSGTDAANEVYVDRTKYFSTDIYHLVRLGRKTVIKYNIASNSFSSIDISINMTDVVVGLNENIDFFVFVRNTSNKGIIYKINGTEAIKINTNVNCYAKFCISSKNEFIYVYSLTTDNASSPTFYKVNVNTNEVTIIKAVGNLDYAGHLMIVADDESCLFINGELHTITTGSLKLLTVNQEVSSCIGQTSINVYNYNTDAEAMLAYDKSLTNVSTVMKYKNETLCSDSAYVYNLIYAYFGAPATEIPEST